MYIPDYLYFEPKRLAEKLTTQFTGKLDVPHAIAGDPRCWRKEDITGITQKKTIILSDYRLTQTDENKAEQLKESIKKLLKEGFSVYLWQENGPLELTQDNIGLLLVPSVRKDCTPLHVKDIAKAMATKKVPPEGLEVMDIDDIDHLEKEIQESKTLPKPQKTIDILDVIRSGFTLTDIKKIYLDRPIIASRSLDTKENEEVKKWILKFQPTLPISNHKFYIQSQEDADEFLAKVKEDEVKHLELTYNQLPLPLDPFLQKTKKVEYLKINSIEHLMAILDSGITLPQVQTLDLSMIQFFDVHNEEFFLDFLKLMPQLTKAILPESFKNKLFVLRTPNLSFAPQVSLESSSHIIEIENEDDLDAVKETLAVSKGYEKVGFDIHYPINANQLMDLIKQVENLQTLSLTAGVSEGTLPLESVKTLHIIALMLSGEIPKEIEEALLFASPNIEALLISDAKGADVLKKYTFKNLNHLHFIHDYKIGDFSQLSELIPHFAPNINRLQLIFSSSPTRENREQYSPDALKLSNLKSINLLNQNVDYESNYELVIDLHHFIARSCDNVDELSLLKAPFVFEPNSQIRSISIEEVYKGASLYHLLGIMPNLESLNIQKMQDPYNRFSEPDLDVTQGKIPLPEKLKLKHLLLPNNTYPNADFLFQIISRSSNLTTLSIPGFNCSKELLFTLEQNNVKLPNLKNVSFNGSNLTIEDYVRLRKIAPNLEFIDITGTPASQYAQELKKDPSIQIVIDNYGQTQTATSGVTNNQHESSHGIDTDTSLNEYHFKVNRVFSNIHGGLPPPVNYYRNSIFHKVEYSDDKRQPFKLTNDEDTSLRPFQDYVYGADGLDKLLQEAKQKQTNTLLGQHQMMLTNTFQALPSLSPNEVLRAIDVQGLNKGDIEIQYSDRDNLYSIRKKSAGQSLVSINFLIDVPAASPAVDNRELVQFYQYIYGFGQGALSNDDLETIKHEELLNKMYEQRVGRCEQRALVFKKLAEKKFPNIPVRVITNDCHAYVEVMQNGHWLQWDLGGYPSHLEVVEPAKYQKSTEKSAVPMLKLIEKEPIKLTQEMLDKRYVTWEPLKLEDTSPDSVALRAISAVDIDAKDGALYGQNVMIQCETDDDANKMCLNLQYLCKHTKRPYYVINHPDDIVCASKWLKREKDNTGKSMKGPGGALYDFLTHDYKDHENPVLIVNWNNFSADDKVRFNSIIADIRLADNTPLPKKMVVAGPDNIRSPKAYKGSDYYSRQTIKLPLPAGQTIVASRYQVVVPEKAKEGEAIDIEHYDIKHLDEMYLGHWTIEAGKVRYVEGPLVRALREGKQLHLHNAPWSDANFQRYWHELKVRGSVQIPGEAINIPPTFWQSVTQSNGYDWDKLLQDVRFLDKPELLPKPLCINSSNFNQFIDHFKIIDGKPFATKSLFANFENQSVNCVINSALNTGEWHQLLKEAQKYHVKLNIAIPQGVKLPQTLQSLINPPPLIDSFKPSHLVELYETTDTSFTVEKIKKIYANDKPLVIDISECEIDDVFCRTTSTIMGDDLIFGQKYSQIWEALKNKRTVVLKGHFNPDLMSACASLALEGHLNINGKPESVEGKLILISDMPFVGLKSEKENPTLKEKLDWIFNNIAYSSESKEMMEDIKKHPWPPNISLSHMRASVLHYLNAYPPSFDYLAGIVKIPKTNPSAGYFDLNDENVDEVCRLFVNKRLNQLKELWLYGQCAFVGGKTGVGKSTFMKRYLTEENGFHLYHELQGLREYAKDKTKGVRKVLFFDEANLGDLDFTMFYGLYEIPPFILYEGEIIELTEDHLVVFAGNPMSYGGERHLPYFIAENVSATTFDIIPAEYIYRDMLLPIFKAAKISKDKSVEYSQCILAVYQYICSLSEDEILITPRELKEMALMISASKTPDADMHWVIHELAKQCLGNKNKEKFTSWFKTRYPGASLEPPKVDVPPSLSLNKPFILTDSKKPIFDMLTRMLHVRALAIQSNNKDLQLTGLGGMILEGEPGTGKSHFIIDTLVRLGFNEIPLDEMEQVPPQSQLNGFCVIPASLAFSEKKRLLMKAAEQGIQVVMDEINSGPMMEQLLNDLLMGIHPDTKKPLEKGGLLLFGTQNSIAEGGRQVTTHAITHRSIFYQFEPNTKDEMKLILTKSFPMMPNKTIDKHIAFHLMAVQYAKENHCEPLPVFRDLYKRIEIKSRKYKYQAQPQSDKKSPLLIPALADRRDRSMFHAMKIQGEAPISLEQLTVTVKKSKDMPEAESVVRRGLPIKVTT